MNYVKLSDNPLKPRTVEFLKSDNIKGFNKGEYLNGLGNHFERSVRYFHHILKFPQNLTNEVIDDKINAQTFHLFLDRALVDFGKSWSSKRYDFRTVELARLLFHISANYLKNSPTWKDEKFIESDIERLAYHFRALAKTELDKKSQLTISEEKENKINLELKKLEKKIEFEKNDPKGKWFKQNKLHEELAEKRIEYHNTWARLENQLPEAELKKGMELVELKEKVKTAKNLEKSLITEILEVQKQRDETLKNIGDKQSKLHKELSHKFDHLLEYYCPLDVLPAFNGQRNFHLDDDDKDKIHYSTRDFGKLF